MPRPLPPRFESISLPDLSQPQLEFRAGEKVSPAATVLTTSSAGEARDAAEAAGDFAPDGTPAVSRWGKVAPHAIHGDDRARAPDGRGIRHAQPPPRPDRFRSLAPRRLRGGPGAGDRGEPRAPRPADPRAFPGRSGGPRR